MLPTFETLINFPAVIIDKSEDTTFYNRIHENGDLEIIAVCDKEPIRMMSYGIDTSKDIAAINDLLSVGTYSNNDEFKNQVQNLKTFIGSDV